MSDILQDARNWLASLPERIGTHWPECHTDRHHAPCLVRKLADEIARLREAIRRLADQDATLSVCDGNVTVTMDDTLTDEEREAIEFHLGLCTQGKIYRDTLRKLLERLA